MDLHNVFNLGIKCADTESHRSGITEKHVLFDSLKNSFLFAVRFPIPDSKSRRLYQNIGKFRAMGMENAQQIL